MIELISTLSWQHQVIVGEIFLSLVLAIYYFSIQHTAGRIESVFWGVSDLAMVGLLLWGGATLSVFHLLLGGFFAYGAYRNLSAVFVADADETPEVVPLPLVAASAGLMAFGQIFFLTSGL